MTAGMAYHEFSDEKGERWKVWDVTPDESIFAVRTPTPSSQARLGEERSQQAKGEVTPSRSRGWLAFQSNEENRRLSPIPPRWEEASDADLAAYLRKANPVQNRYRA